MANKAECLRQECLRQECASADESWNERLAGISAFERMHGWLMCAEARPIKTILIIYKTGSILEVF